MNDWLQGHRRLAIFGTLVALQVVALVGFIAREEIFLRTGTEILVESQPVDPRDPLRGDFIILGYAFEQLDRSEVIGTLAFSPGENAYVWMRRVGDYWEPYEVSRERPGRDELDELDAVALRGRVTSSSVTSSSFRGTLHLSFTNIGQFFVPQGEGNPPEPPDVRLVVDGDGSARVRGLEIDGEPWP